MIVTNNERYSHEEIKWRSSGTESAGRGSEIILKRMERRHVYKLIHLTVALDYMPRFKDCILWQRGNVAGLCVPQAHTMNSLHKMNWMRMYHRDRCTWCSMKCVLPNRACSCMHAIITSSLSFSVSGTMCSYFGREALIEIISSAALDRDWKDNLAKLISAIKIICKFLYWKSWKNLLFLGSENSKKSLKITPRPQRFPCDNRRVFFLFLFFPSCIRVEVTTRKHLGSAKGPCLPGYKRTTRIVCQA